MLTYTGEVKNNVVTIHSPERFKREVASCFPDQPIVLTVDKPKRKRSNNQNEYYWGVVVELIRQSLKERSGFDLTKEETHDFLKSKFNSIEVAGLLIPKSTTALSTEQFNQYIETIVKWAAEILFLVIPEPTN